MARNANVTSEWSPSGEAAREVSNAELAQAIAELEQARGGGYSQPKRIIKSFDKKAFDHPFQGAGGLGMFLKAVRECGTGSPWQNHRSMKTYVEKAAQYIEKTLPSGMNETVGSDGGFLVPPEYANQILMRSYDNDILERTTMFPLGSGNTLKIPAINETSRADGSRFGGVAGYWRDEADTLTASKPNLHQVTLTLDSLIVLVRATQELIDDASGISLESFINMVVPQEMQFKVGQAIVNGNGVTKPLGLRHAQTTCRLSISKETGQAAATIVTANILKMWARMHPSCKKNAIWLVDPSVSTALAQMTVGTAGAQMAVYMPPGGMSGAPYATLLGRPVIETEFNAQLGTVGDIVLWDPTTYVTAAKQGVQAATSMHVYFTSNEMSYRFVQRLDGRSWWLAPLTPLSGGDTLSCIIVLETRS